MCPFEHQLGGNLMHDLFITLGGIAFVNVLGWLTPGPNMLAVMSASVSKGRRAGVATGAGLALGGLIWATLTILGPPRCLNCFPRL